MFDSQVSHALVVGLTKGIIDLGKPFFLNIELFAQFWLWLLLFFGLLFFGLLLLFFHLLLLFGLLLFFLLLFSWWLDLSLILFYFLLFFLRLDWRWVFGWLFWLICWLFNISQQHLYLFDLLEKTLVSLLEHFHFFLKFLILLLKLLDYGILLSKYIIPGVPRDFVELGDLYFHLRLDLHSFYFGFLSHCFDCFADTELIL